MVWQSEASVVVGKHQNIAVEVDLDFARSNNIRVVRRQSGGGAVYHDAGNINLTFIESNTQPDFNKYILQIKQMLQSIGVLAQSDERNSIYIDGKKISGSAQFIRRNKSLFHATLLYSTNLTNLLATLDGKSIASTSSDEKRSKFSVKSVKSPVTNICEFLPESWTLIEFKNFIINYLMAIGTNNSLYSFTQMDLNAIEQLKLEKYDTTSWNFHA